MSIILKPEMEEFFNNLKGIEIDVNSLSEQVTKKYRNKLEKDSTLVTMTSKFIIQNKREYWGIWDNELCGNVKEPLEISFFEKTKTGFGLVPFCILGFYVANDLLINYPYKEVLIKEFMGSRYAYNSRIESNMYEFKEWYKKN